MHIMIDIRLGFISIMMNNIGHYDEHFGSFYVEKVVVYSLRMN